MGLSRKDKQSTLTRLLVAAAIACAWLAPSTTAMASTAGDNVQVKVSVVDSVGVSIGGRALEMVSSPRTGEVIIEFATGTASFPKGGLQMEKLRMLGAEARFGLPVGRGAAYRISDAVPGGSAVPATRVVVTVSKL